MITFQLLRDSHGHRILLREVEEEGVREARAAASPNEDILLLAERFGVRDGFEQVRNELLGRGYRSFQKRSGLNFSIGSRLQTFWIKPVEGRLHIGYLSSNVPALYGVEESTALTDLGPNWIDLQPAEAVQRVRDWADTIDRYRAQSGEHPEPLDPMLIADDNVASAGGLPTP